MNANENASLSEKISEAVQKNRKPIFISLAAAVLLLVCIIATLSLMDVFRKKAISAADDFNRRYEELRFTINEEASAPKVEVLLAELNAFAPRHSGYAGARAWSILASVHADKKEWAESEAAALAAARAAPKTWLAPAAYFNAAVAAEEQGKNAEAIEHYERAIACPAAFSGAARAQFSIGRLHEGLSAKDAALEAYRAVISGWPYDAVWTSLAHSRIIALEVK